MIVQFNSFIRSVDRTDHQNDPCRSCKLLIFNDSTIFNKNDGLLIKIYETRNLQINKLYTFYFIKIYILMIVLYDFKINDFKIIKTPVAGEWVQLPRNNFIVKITLRK